MSKIHKIFLLIGIATLFFGIGLYFVFAGSQNEMLVSFDTSTGNDDSSLKNLATNEIIRESSSSTESAEKQIDTDEKQIPVSTIHSEYAFNVGDPKVLSGWADNIFFARIISKFGELPDHRVPQTQYSADIVFNIKGKLDGRVTINQSGVGFAEGKLFVNEGDLVTPADVRVDPKNVFLREGSIYLFVVGHDREKNWYTISAPPYDRELITPEANLSDIAALSRAHENARVQAYVTAARELGVLNPEWGE